MNQVCKKYLTESKDVFCAVMDLWDRIGRNRVMDSAVIVLSRWCAGQVEVLSGLSAVFMSKMWVEENKIRII